MAKVNPNNLKRGDILLVHREKGPQHTAIYIGGGRIVHASLNEKGTTTGGKTGDQTGREITTRDYYDRPWDYVLRYPDSVLADEYTTKAEQIAADNSHGYDQIHRNGPDFDCSSLVCYVVRSVGIPVTSTYTGNMKAGFLKCGFQIIDTNAPESPVTSPSGGNDKTYVVKKGDTLTAICARCGVSIDEIMNANKFLKNPNKIYIGDKLTIPTKSEAITYAGKVRTFHGSPLNIRAAGSMSARILGTIKNGSAVTTTSKTGEWLKLADRPGFVSSKYIIF